TQDLHRTSAALLVSVSGIDQTVAQAIHTRHTYYAADILWNHQLKDIMHIVDAAPKAIIDEATDPEDERSVRYIDFSDFHEVEPISSADQPSS
ncbi:MAG: hypothetical protein AAGL17_08440, partial [Cyanobacteria bacterium J06576_12]